MKNNNKLEIETTNIYKEVLEQIKKIKDKDNISAEELYAYVISRNMKERGEKPFFVFSDAFKPVQDFLDTLNKDSNSEQLDTKKSKSKNKDKVSKIKSHGLTIIESIKGFIKKGKDYIKKTITSTKEKIKNLNQTYKENVKSSLSTPIEKEESKIVETKEEPKISKEEKSKSKNKDKVSKIKNHGITIIDTIKGFIKKGKDYIKKTITSTKEKIKNLKQAYKKNRKSSLNTSVRKEEPKVEKTTKAQEKNKENISKENSLETSNEKLAEVLKKNGIKNFKLTSLGNSIGSGYSVVKEVKPLLLRNETLENKMKDNNINLERHNFARAQNNNDEHVFEWLVTNTKESDINKMNRVDYGNGSTSMETVNMTDDKLNKYFPEKLKDDKGLQDTILESHPDMANIVVYNGCTGSFLDAVTRDGNFSQKLGYGFKRDTYSIEATLKFIQSSNRNNDTNTQVYLCGIPNYLGLKATEIANKKLRKIADKYANVVYVPPVKTNLISKNENNSKKIDINYSEEEYKEFNNNIIKSISENYSVEKAMINLDRNLYDFNKELEMKDKSLSKDVKEIENNIFSQLEKESETLSNSKEKLSFYNKANKYLEERFPYDFFYIGKDNINNSIKKSKTYIKK